jgi:hypothetical protein
MFRDDASASRMLASLRHRESLQTVWVFDAEGNPFAHEDAVAAAGRPQPDPAGERTSPTASSKRGRASSRTA